ncbi:MAG TPA: L,D-transpeptidase [Ignavibacteria bacterium]|nr:L,D-transpeptidase [Ignavibacteria bacterium]
MPEVKFSDNNINMQETSKNNIYFFIVPVIIVIFTSFGVKDIINDNSFYSKSYNSFETKGGEIKNAGKFNILSSEDMSSSLKDTIYTDKETWLELKINEQMLYQHWRNGTTVKYPVSSGNNKGGDPEALESRPGLFAIFLKVEHHKSSQFNAANMYHFMPFNQGIGFHSIDGTGYYGHLGVRPSSHGCIRMKHSDAEKLFNESPIGTLVLATKGYSARTVAFAPENFENSRNYEKDEYKFMLANNLYNILNSRYYLEEKERFVIDPKVIPVSGIYTSYDVKIPEKQIVPRSFVTFYEKGDKVKQSVETEILLQESSDEMLKLVSIDNSIEETPNSKIAVNSSGDLIKKYFNNPIGVLPYFGPKK